MSKKCFCKNCGNEIKEGASFCSACGCKLTEDNKPIKVKTVIKEKNITPNGLLDRIITSVKQMSTLGIYKLLTGLLLLVFAKNAFPEYNYIHSEDVTIAACFVFAGAVLSIVTCKKNTGGFIICYIVSIYEFGQAYSDEAGDWKSIMMLFTAIAIVCWWAYNKRRIMDFFSKRQ